VIDRGSNADLADPDQDQRGLLRPVDFPGLANAAAGNGTDIGAFEVEKSCATQTKPGGTCASGGGGGGGNPPAPGPAGPTGQRAAALKKCKKLKGRTKAKKRKKCMKHAKRLPV